MPLVNRLPVTVQWKDKDNVVQMTSPAGHQLQISTVGHFGDQDMILQNLIVNVRILVFFNSGWDLKKFMSLE